MIAQNAGHHYTQKITNNTRHELSYQHQEEQTNRTSLYAKMLRASQNGTKNVKTLNGTKCTTRSQLLKHIPHQNTGVEPRWIYFSTWGIIVCINNECVIAV